MSDKKGVVINYHKEEIDPNFYYWMVLIVIFLAALAWIIVKT